MSTPNTQCKQIHSAKITFNHKTVNATFPDSRSSIKPAVIVISHNMALPYKTLWLKVIHVSLLSVFFCSNGQHWPLRQIMNCLNSVMSYLNTILSPHLSDLCYNKSSNQSTSLRVVPYHLHPPAINLITVVFFNKPIFHELLQGRWGSCENWRNRTHWMSFQLPIYTEHEIQYLHYNQKSAYPELSFTVFTNYCIPYFHNK